MVRIVWEPGEEAVVAVIVEDLTDLDLGVWPDGTLIEELSAQVVPHAELQEQEIDNALAAGAALPVNM
jgi:hypothetical protein